MTEKPIRSMALGFAIRFQQGKNYRKVACKVCMESLRRLAFSGRCELYGQDHERYGEYVLGIALRHHTEPHTPDIHWWKAFVRGVEDSLKGKLVLCKLSCELARVRAMRMTMTRIQVLELHDGYPVSDDKEDNQA